MQGAGDYQLVERWDGVGRGEVKAAFTSSWFIYIPVYHPGPLLGDTECKTTLSPEG